MALIMASMTVGRSFSFAPDLYKAKLAAKNIFRLLDRKPRIGNGDGDYTCPVSVNLVSAVVLIEGVGKVCCERQRVATRDFLANLCMGFG